MSGVVLIAAVARNGVIGRDGALPWRLPEDLQRFKRLTVGKTVLMGRKTWDSLGRPLPDRQNWVLSRDPQFAPAGARLFRSLAAALAAPREGDLMVIGGAELYRQALPYAVRLELTEVEAEVEGDTRFPDFDPGQWPVVAESRWAADARHDHACRFVTRRRSDGPLR